MNEITLGTSRTKFPAADKNSLRAIVAHRQLTLGLSFTLRLLRSFLYGWCYRSFTTDVCRRPLMGRS
jgi:hypothetical protein